MSVLNLPLAHTALKHGVMLAYAEKAIKNCNSMAAIRTVVESMEAEKEEEINTVAKLTKNKMIIRLRRLLFQLLQGQLHMQRSDLEIWGFTV